MPAITTAILARSTARTTAATALVAAMLAISGCTAAPRPGATLTTTARTMSNTHASQRAGDTSGTTPPTATPPAVTPTRATSSATRSPATPDPASIEALVDAHYDGRNLRLGREGGSTAAYRQYFVTYQGDGLTISGRINIPRGPGPFPAVVLAHGYVPIADYTNGATMLRERDYLARHGYVTLHIDYRNHAQSSDDPRLEADLRTGYVKDAINAGLALRQFNSVDPERIGIIGRSMGGGVVYGALVARPDLFRAGVAYSPVSSDTVDTFTKWIRPDRSHSSAVREILARLGTPEAQPARWATTSPRTYFSRITAPILIHHGTADAECPIQWSEETVAALRAAGKQVTFDVYPGQPHTFTSQWPLSIRRTAAFLDEHLR
ncbi:peptidase S9 [Intrasporangium chromatireducens Q5-1]|uniref:Peptidase S9 n=1 Tax=Intrasporangium chromatireducens Q5-1 TaxID=584657 RepID=W9GQN5_9MICO|nr:peptidase S9 [Intrasporangium chromatireducens Q5-1]